MGFEPTNGGFADLSLGPLGYRAERFSIAKCGKSSSCSTAFQTLYLTPLERIPYSGDQPTGGGIVASRMKRADSSGGVGLM